MDFIVHRTDVNTHELYATPTASDIGLSPTLGGIIPHSISRYCVQSHMTQDFTEHWTGIILCTELHARLEALRRIISYFLDFCNRQPHKVTSRRIYRTVVFMEHRTEFSVHWRNFIAHWSSSFTGYSGILAWSSSPAPSLLTLAAG